MQIRLKVLDVPELLPILGREETPFPLAGESLQDLLQALAVFHGPPLERILLDGRGRFSAALQVLVNGRLCGQNLRAGQSVPLAEGDQVAFLIPLDGG